MNTAIVNTPLCPVCKRSGKIEVRLGSFRAWMQGALIQDAFSELDQSQRELLMTGTHAHCWEQTWAGFEEEE